jgi:hypothetical protein
VFTRRTPSPDPGLHVCRVCHTDYVVPVWWEALDGERWRMLLRCAQCETRREVVIAEAAARVYERDLARGIAEIAAALERDFARG